MVFARETVGNSDQMTIPMRKRQYSVGPIVGVWIGGVVLLAAAWGFIYREPIEYSKIIDQLLQTRA